MTFVSSYSSIDQIECKFSIGIPKGKVLALKRYETQIPKMKPRGKVLTGNLGHYKLEIMLEPNKAFIRAKRFVSSSSWFSRKIALVQ